jgi:hypothetical protein
LKSQPKIHKIILLAIVDLAVSVARSEVIFFVLALSNWRRKEKDRMKRKMMQWVTWYMVLAMFTIGITPRVYAGFSPSEAMTVSRFDRTADLEKIQKVLELKMISERLRQLGFVEEGIQQRLNQLSDEQIHRLALKMDELKVGGNGAEVVISVLVIAMLVVILIYLLGHKIAIK